MKSVLKPLLAGEADVVIGAFPARASYLRRLAWRYFRGLTGLELEDITSGFRAYNPKAMKLLASPEASLLDYQDVGVLLILHRNGLRVVEVPVPMQPRTQGISRVFNSWWTVGRYMLQTSLLCIARVGYGRSAHSNRE
ncbi:Glycosyl transferase [Imhoffiella purpurea]|uniref:Glycosyl transferase n=1 Tax=Imhoffiella purpurea TaxID=1249627 RepID=W9VCL3_9GAMM|nr:Glycosyl transferase [Imhoffiella purpurea]